MVITHCWHVKESRHTAAVEAGTVLYIVNSKARTAEEILEYFERASDVVEIKHKMVEVF